jgi:uncharacterized Zn finger protein
MDSGNGKFEQFNSMHDLIKKHPERLNIQNKFDASGIFQVGEILEIKGSHFRVRSIKSSGLSLRLLPKNSALING